MTEIERIARGMFEYIEFLVLADAIDPAKAKLAGLIPADEMLQRWEKPVRDTIPSLPELGSFDRLRCRVLIQRSGS